MQLRKVRKERKVVFQQEQYRAAIFAFSNTSFTS